MAFDPKKFAGAHCGCRYQQDYRPTLGRDGKKESGTLEVIKFYYDGAIRFEQHCYGEAATFVFGVWASGMYGIKRGWCTGGRSGELPQNFLRGLMDRGDNPPCLQHRGLVPVL